MKIIYITEPNCSIHQSGNRIIVKQMGRKFFEVPILNVSCIVVFGNTQISTQALNMFFSQSIDVVFLSMAGLIKGRIASEKSSNIVLRIAQYRRWEDENYRLNFAKKIAAGKIINQQRVLKLYRSKITDDFTKITREMNYLIQTINNAEFSNEIMGCEGRAASLYFGCFNRIIKNFNFSGRARRPAYDPINALLNFGYAFLKNEIEIRLNIMSFDCELGFYHGIRYGRESLALDLMEEFRPIIIDKHIIAILNRSIFRDDDFIINEEGCRLDDISIKKFIELYQDMMSKKSYENLNYKQILDLQINKFRSSIIDGSEYNPWIKD